MSSSRRMDVFTDEDVEALLAETPPKTDIKYAYKEKIRQMEDLIDRQKNCIRSIRERNHVLESELAKKESAELEERSRKSQEDQVVAHQNDLSKHDDLLSRGSHIKESIIAYQLCFLNTAPKEELKKKLRGIGERKSSEILELREIQPFESLDDLEKIGMSAKQIKRMMKDAAANFFL